MTDQVSKVYSFSCKELVEYLTHNGFSTEVCKVIGDNEVDGGCFMELNERDFKGMFSQSDIVEKMIKFQKKEMSSESQRHRLLRRMSSAYLVLDTSQTQALFREYLSLLGLTDKFPKKLTMRDAMLIREETLGNVETTDKLKVLPYLILQKIMMFDIRSRASLYTGELHGSSLLQNFDEINPLDNMVTLLHCCNNFLTQDILKRLSTCQLAIPFLLPNPVDGSVTYLLWGMREIIRAWKSTNSNGSLASNECRFVDYPAPIVSFYKIGKLHQSKSKIINEVISESKVDYFFCGDCEGGSSQHLFANGMAELCCYMPSGRTDVHDFYSDMVIFANLQGDARKHTKQTNFMQSISFMSFVLLQENDVDDTTFELLRNLANSPGGVILMFADLKSNQDIKNEFFLQQINGMRMIKIKGKNLAQIRIEVRKEIVQKLKSVPQTHHKRLSECLWIAQSLGIRIDEDDQGCKDGKDLAEKIMKQVTSYPTHEAKLKILPLQGPELWHKWGNLDKEMHRQVSRDKMVDAYSKEIEIKKKSIRQNQIKKITKAMQMFSSYLLMHTGNVRHYFLHWFKMLIDDHSRKILPNLSHAYQKTRNELLQAKEQNKNQQKDSGHVRKLKDQLKLQNEHLVNALFGLEHFFREMGQLYEAVMENRSGGCSKILHEVSSYPQIVADLMSEGFPVELMDGDAGHVPIRWVSAVIDKLKNQHLHNRKILIISVLGVQSTGKSTLLNTTFGLRFNVSAGRCTRGAYFQFLSFDSALCMQTGCDHILIVDTEGLRAPELQYKESQIHDNELATFVIGLADMTIVNIYGETPGELTDILQTSVHAFIRMKNVDMQLSFHFVHQNVTAVNADSKSKVGRQNFLDSLDQMTKTAAEIENCERKYQSFQDVIEFNEEKSVTLFPGLWKGDPPMAPVNPGYSFQACTLKEKIISIVRDKQGKGEFATFQLRVKALWNAILKENFIFRFKNTLEIKAYNEIDTKCNEWACELQQEFLNWQQRTRYQINSCDEAKIKSVVDDFLLEIEKTLNDKHLKLNNALVEFFEMSKLSETLVQWRKSTEIKISTLCDEHKAEAKKHCDVLRHNRECKVQIDNIKQTHHRKLHAEIINQASDTALNARRCQEIFDNWWQKWIRELSKNIKSVGYVMDNHMEFEITALLDEIHYAHAQLVTEGLNQRQISSRGTLKVDVVQLHLNVFRNNWMRMLGLYGKSSGRHADVWETAKTQTQIFFQEIEKGMQDIMDRWKGFDKDSIANLLRKLQRSIDEFNHRQHDFTFTPHYQVDMAITVAGYAYEKFIKGHIEMEIVEILGKIYCANAHLILEGLNHQPLSKRGILNLSITDLHLESSRQERVSNSSIRAMKSRAFAGRSIVSAYTGRYHDCHFAQTQTFELFGQVEQWMRTITESCQYFSKSSVANLLMKLQKSIDKLNKGNNNFIFTQHYQVDMAITVAGYAYHNFLAHKEKVALENNPAESMNQLKPVIFRTFQTQFTKVSEDQAAAQTFSNMLRKHIEKGLIEKLQIEIVTNMKHESINFRRKNDFKILILKDLAAAQNFELYKDYLRNITKSFKYWLKVYVTRHCETRTRNGNTNLYYLAEVTLNEMITQITKAITKTSNLPENIASVDTASIIDDYSHYFDYGRWLRAFHDQVRRVITVDLQELMVINNIHHLAFFAKQLLKNLKHTHKDILYQYVYTDQSIARLTTDSPTSPHMVLYNSLIGCKEQCPFCNEQCEITDENHIRFNKPHYTEIHRPACLGGCNHEDGTLVFETCNKAIETNKRFQYYYGYWYYYKDYKRFYQDWLISTEGSETGAKYWEWFITRYNSELVTWNRARSSPVYYYWRYITEREAVDSLSKDTTATGSSYMAQPQCRQQ